jgi:hypothetical protein
MSKEIYVKGKYTHRVIVDDDDYEELNEAALAYNELAVKHHGEFARLNEVL